MPDDPYARHNDLLRFVNDDLTIPPLKNIARAAGLSQYGRKSSLQSRIVVRLNELRQANYVAEYDAIRRTILAEVNAHHISRPGWTYSGPPIPAPPPQPAVAVAPVIAEPVVFKPNPFYSVLSQLVGPNYCGAQPEGKSTFSMTVRFTPPQAEKLHSDASYRVYLLSALSEDVYRHAMVNYPPSMEIRVNGKTVPTNLRGLKNKPGTAKPADLTAFLVKEPNARNVIDVLYAYTRQRYVVTVSLVRRRSVQDIVTRIVSGKHLARETVIAQIAKKSDDEDIITTSTVMSLKCPLSFSRMQVPIRSIRCSHVQCFDATSYIQLQEQATTWQCPVCNIVAPIEDIVVDGYVDDILKKTPKSVESVEIDPTGVWRVQTVEDDTDSDDERPRSSLRTASIPLEVVLSPRRTPSASASNVIDLSSDDDGPPPSRAVTENQNQNQTWPNVSETFPSSALGDVDDMERYMQDLQDLPEFSDYVSPSPPMQATHRSDTVRSSPAGYSPMVVPTATASIRQSPVSSPSVRNSPVPPHLSSQSPIPPQLYSDSPIPSHMSGRMLPQLSGQPSMQSQSTHNFLGSLVGGMEGRQLEARPAQANNQAPPMRGYFNTMLHDVWPSVQSTTLHEFGFRSSFGADGSRRLKRVRSFDGLNGASPTSEAEATAANRDRESFMNAASGANAVNATRAVSMNGLSTASSLRASSMSALGGANATNVGGTSGANIMSPSHANASLVNSVNPANGVNAINARRSLSMNGQSTANPISADSMSARGSTNATDIHGTSEASSISPTHASLNDTNGMTTVNSTNTGLIGAENAIASATNTSAEVADYIGATALPAGAEDFMEGNERATEFSDRPAEDAIAESALESILTGLAGPLPSEAPLSARSAPSMSPTGERPTKRVNMGGTEDAPWQSTMQGDQMESRV